MDNNTNNIDKLINNSIQKKEETKGNNKQMTNRIKSARNKFIILIFIIIAYILVANYIIPEYNTLQNNLDSLKESQKKIENFEETENTYKKSLKFVQAINNNKTGVINCINNETYDSISENLSGNLEKIGKFLQLNNLSDEKMNINEKYILSNLNEFLLKEDPLDGTNTETNGTINNITIGDEENFNNNFYYTPLELNITFENKDGLLSFINNIENKISEDIENRILYNISEINYDIINYEDEQDVSILMNIFYMK